jgi:alpha-glucosidase (family GH31 glycosyl hydrolase)
MPVRSKNQPINDSAVTVPKSQYMKSSYRIFALSAATLAPIPAIAQQSVQRVVAQQPGQVTMGPARFTVISPTCIRLEYAAANGFVDEPTLFAINRAARDSKAKIKQTSNQVSIETQALRLVYRPDGQAFNPKNLTVTFRNGKRSGSWQPGQENRGNLGGPVPTLDFLNGPINLPNGLASRDGWSLIDDSGKAIRKNDWIAPRPGGGPPSENIEEKNKDLDWYLFTNGQNYQGALLDLARISGPAAMPRRENLGSWNSRWAKMSSDDYRQVVREYEEHDFPLDILVMDMEWHTQNATTGLKWADNLGWTGYTWDKRLIPDPQALLQEFKQKGVYVTLNDHPHDGVRDHEESYPEFMRLLGKTPAKGNNLPFNAGSKEYFDAFWAASHTPSEQMGVDFWWLDWQQDSLIPWVPGVPGQRHLPWLNEIYFQKSQSGGLRGQNYSRWGGWGDQRNPMQFSGDTSSTWRMLAFQIPFSTTSANGGCFYWAHDTGGFFGGVRDAEQYTRWTQFSGLSAALRFHSAGEDRRPWMWGKQAEDAMRVTYRLRSELFPYIYTSVRQSYDSMKPLLRSMYLEHPDQEQAYQASGQYLYGDNVLVAPIVSPGVGPKYVAQQSVWFPEGTWFNYFTGERFSGGSQALVTADLDEVPMYMRAGVPIPMQPYTQRMGTAKISQLRLRSYPGDNGKTGTSTLYEDDGRSPGYQRGTFARTPLTYSRQGNSVQIQVGTTSGTFQGQLPTRSYSIELPGTTKATKATVQANGVALRLTTEFDVATQTNRILIPAQNIRQAITVTVTCGVASNSAMRERALDRRVEGVLGRPVEVKDTHSVLALTKEGTPEQQQMLLATLGVGMMKQADGPNYKDNPGRFVFFAPQGMLEGNRVAISRRAGAGGPGSIKSGVLPLGKATSPSLAPVLDFKIGGLPLQLPRTSNPLLSRDNVALDAKVSAPSTENGYIIDAAADGTSEGYPENAAGEWSAGRKVGAALRLEWTTPQTIDRVVLYDRPNPTDDVTGGRITFSDGSTVDVGALSNNGTEVRFAPKSVTWLSFEVTAVKDGTVSAGVSEIAVFKAPAAP